MAKAKKPTKTDDVDTPETTGREQALEPSPRQAAAWFKPGQSGNPLGRPKGSRNKLGEDFIRDMHEAWQSHGREAIEKVVTERPHEFLKVVAGLLPKEIKIKDELSEFSDEQLAALNALTVALLGDAAGASEEDSAGTASKAIN